MCGIIIGTASTYMQYYTIGRDTNPIADFIPIAV